MKAEIGTLAWGEITRGRLRGGDRVRQLIDALGMRIAGWWPRGGTREFDVDNIIMPDSPASLRAAAACRDAATDDLANHSLRAYLWGALIAMRENRKYDAETFFVAAMMHDIALTKPHEFCDATLHCFALEGAEMTLRESKGWGLDQDKARVAAEAIALHLNVSVSPARHGNEAYLLHEGTTLDVVGLGMDRIHPANHAAVLRRAPRGRLKRELMRSLGRQNKQRPDCRMSFMFQHGLGSMVANAPFEEQEPAVSAGRRTEGA